MGNPYAVQVTETPGSPVRLAGQLTFTDPANQPAGSSGYQLAASFGVSAANSNNLTQLQAALDASYARQGASNINDGIGSTLLLPPGYLNCNGTLGMHPNQTILGQGPTGGSYLVSNATGPVLTLSTGNEVSCGIRNLGLILNAANTDGINFTQTGQSSILSDARHVIENVVVVGGGTALQMQGCTEVRVDNFSAYLQTPPTAAVWLLATDAMFSRITVAQTANYSGGQSAALRANTSNTRFENIKVFGGSSQGVAFLLIGQRNQVVGLEVQDYNAIAVSDAQGHNVFAGLVIDSSAGGFDAGGSVQISDAVFVNRGGGAHTLPYAIRGSGASGLDLRGQTVSVATIFEGAPTTGIRSTVWDGAAWQVVAT